jgi:hypothetical protein
MRVITITEKDGSVMLQVSGINTNDETVYLLEMAKHSILSSVVAKTKPKKKV